MNLGYNILKVNPPNVEINITKAKLRKMLIKVF